MDLGQVYTIRKASKLWDLAKDGSTIRRAIIQGRFPVDGYTKIDEKYLVSHEAMLEYFGKPGERKKAMTLYHCAFYTMYDNQLLDSLEIKAYRPGQARKKAMAETALNNPQNLRLVIEKI